MSQIYIEIFAIRNELCFGRIYDTNSFWLAEQVTKLGAKVQRITCIPDDIDVICSSVKESINRNPQFIILTGGLGPTSDDLTIEALSKIFKLEIIINRKILEAMAEKRQMPVERLPPNLVKMARSLKGSECLPNPVGWAPVTIIKSGDITTIALPGPPEEVKACFKEHLAKRIRKKTKRESESKRILVKMYESQISPLTEDVMRKIPGTYLKPLISQFQTDKGLPIDITVFAENKEACQKKIGEVIKRLEELIT